MPGYALAIHGLFSLAANPKARRGFVTGHIPDPVLRQVSGSTFMGDRLSTHRFVPIFPLAEPENLGLRLHGQSQLLHEGWASSVRWTLYSL